MDDLASEIMRVIEQGASPAFEDMLLERVEQELIKGASLVPHITTHLKKRYIQLDKARRWLDLGFDPNTQLVLLGAYSNSPPTRGTLLDSTLWTAYRMVRDEKDTYKLVELLCSRGTRVTSEMCGDHKGDNNTGKMCRRILRAHHTSQVLVVLVASRIVVPELAGVLKRFLV